MAPDPEVAVVVYAYSRKEYLPFALHSIAAQTLPRPRFELVVVKNFADADIDRRLDELGAISLWDDGSSNGSCLHRGLRASRAPIVTFLDDDDEYEPDRLERLLEAMREHPDVGFYRNRVRVIDGAGRPIPRDRWRPHETDATFDVSGPVYVRAGAKPGNLVRLAAGPAFGSFNTSSMAIRRELVDGDVGATFDEMRQLVDSFLFLTGVISPLGIYLDDRRLTRYRYAPKARYRYTSGNSPRSVTTLGWSMSAERAMASLAARHGRADFARWLADKGDFFERVFRGSGLVQEIAEGARRAEVVRSARELAEFLRRAGVAQALRPDVWRAGAYALAYLGAPRITQRVARAHFALGTFG